MRMCICMCWIVALNWYDKGRSREANEDGVKGAYRVDVDVPADEWINVTSFYDVLVFNSGHWYTYNILKDLNLLDFVSYNFVKNKH